jgi:hypothetical protein
MDLVGSQRHRAARLCALGLAAGVMVGAGCATTNSEGLSADEATVELDAFSGRENPSWQLTEAERAEFVRRFEELRPATGATWPAPQLGYRGFKVDLKLAGVSAPRQMDVGFGLVVVRVGNDVPAYYLDDKGLEAFLADQARQRGFESLRPGL